MTEFADLELAPSAEFAARLEAELLRDLGDTTDTETPIFDIRSIEPTRGRSATWVRQLSMLAAAAALVVFVATSISSTREEHLRPSDAATTTMVTSTSVPVEFLPMPPPHDEVGAGTYTVTHFDIPFTVHTEGTWIHEKNWLRMFSLLRLSGPKVAVTSGLFDGATPSEAIAHFCPSAIDTSTPVETMLLDQPALQVTARATGTCAFPIAGDTEARVSVGDIVQVTATSVDGKVVVVVASALWPLWPELEAEITALLASMHPIK